MFFRGDKLSNTVTFIEPYSLPMFDFQNKSKYSERKALSIFMVILLKAAKKHSLCFAQNPLAHKRKRNIAAYFFHCKKTTTLTFVIKCGTTPFVESKLFPRICSKAGDEFVTKK